MGFLGFAIVEYVGTTRTWCVLALLEGMVSYNLHVSNSGALVASSQFAQRLALRRIDVQSFVKRRGPQISRYP